MMRRFYALPLLLIALLMPTGTWADDLKRWDVFEVDGITYMVANTNPLEVYVGRSRVIETVESIEFYDKIPTYGAVTEDVTGPIVIPSNVLAPDGKSYTVTQISQEAFSNRTGITSVSIPNTVTIIGMRSFYGCI